MARMLNGEVGTAPSINGIKAAAVAAIPGLSVDTWGTADAYAIETGDAVYWPQAVLYKCALQRMPGFASCASAPLVVGRRSIDQSQCHVNATFVAFLGPRSCGSSVLVGRIITELSTTSRGAVYIGIPSWEARLFSWVAAYL